MKDTVFILAALLTAAVQAVEPQVGFKALRRMEGDRHVCFDIVGVDLYRVARLVPAPARRDYPSDAQVRSRRTVFSNRRASCKVAIENFVHELLN